MPPDWDGSDVWPLDPDSLVDGMSVDQPIYRTDTAYVADGVLVASLAAGALVFNDGTGSHLDIKLSGAFLTATVIQGPNGIGLTGGVLSAKWSETSMFHALDDFRTNGAPICIDDFTFTYLRSTICDRLDINADAPNVAEPCDALSVGLTFEAEPAQLGAAGQMPAATPGCDLFKNPSSMPCSN